MYKTKKSPGTFIKERKSFPGEPLEYKIRRVTTLGEPIQDAAPLEYDDEDSDEISPDHNIRNDKWERAERLMEQELTDRESTNKTLTDRQTTENDGEVGKKNDQS